MSRHGSVNSCQLPSCLGERSTGPFSNSWHSTHSTLIPVSIYFACSMSTTAASLIEAALNASGGNATSTTATITTTSGKPNFVVVKNAPMNTPLEPLLHVGDGIFLQTKTAQVLAGVCVWAALFITCQQVSTYYLLN